MDLYCWAGVAILLIIGGIALMCLWNKSNSLKDDIDYLTESLKAAHDNTSEAARLTTKGFTKFDDSLRKLEVRFSDDLLKQQKDHDHDVLKHDEWIGDLKVRMSATQGAVDTLDESIGLMEKNASDAESRIDAHEKRLNDQMSHILNDEKKLAVLGARVDGQDAVTQVTLAGFDAIAGVYRAALATGTFTIVEEPKKSRGRKRA